MSLIRVKGEKGRYWVSNKNCIGCTCLSLGAYQHRGATMSGSRNTGAVDLCCLTNAYHGCPREDQRGYSEELKRERRQQGMKVC